MERFEEIYARHREAVTAYVRRRAPESVVDDVVSETFLVCWRKLDHVPDEPLPWLYAVARKTLANTRRTQTRQAIRPVGSGFVEPAPVGDNALAAAFGRLSERDREVLRLVAWEALSMRDAATVLGCTPVTCRVRFHRARQRLAAHLETANHLRPNPEGVTR